MILGPEIIFITISVVVILGGLVYLFQRPGKGDKSRKEDGDLPI